MPLEGAEAGSSPRTWGTPRARWFLQQKNAVHPHARGEHKLTDLTDQELFGSSPRTWGTLRAVRYTADLRRFIPTHVGNTHVLLAAHPARPVHPHARGEHSVLACLLWEKGGSSPRTWGTQTEIWRQSLDSRFIPTHVGNTLQAVVSARWSAVHPHARGEHCRRHRQVVHGNGSSPRTWGTRLVHAGIICVSRFIPTHVGNTWQYPGMTLRDYGSSPRTWGTRRCSYGGPQCFRFIPTHVGNTPRHRRTRIKATVHPHARGEHT